MYADYSIMFGHHFFLNVVHNHVHGWFGVSSTGLNPLLPSAHVFDLNHYLPIINGVLVSLCFYLSSVWLLVLVWKKENGGDAITTVINQCNTTWICAVEMAQTRMSCDFTKMTLLKCHLLLLPSGLLFHLILLSSPSATTIPLNSFSAGCVCHAHPRKCTLCVCVFIFDQ